MIAVTVNRQDLLGKLRARRDAHLKAYADACAGWKLEANEQLDDFLKRAAEAVQNLRTRVDAADQAKGDKPVPLALPPGLFQIKAHPPESHVRDYDRAIAALDNHVGETFEVPAELFDQWVRDDFGWKESFETIAADYGGKLRAARR